MRKSSLFLGIILISCVLWNTSCDRNKVTCGSCKFEILEKDSIMDVDGNLYSQVKIGDQTWLGENLRCTHFADYTPIDNYDTMLYARYAYPFGQVDSVKKYGLLYNWAAARHSHDTAVNSAAKALCPDGFHLPTDEEWHELVYFVSNCTSNNTKQSVAKMLAAHDSCWRVSTVPNTPGFVSDTIPDTNNTSHFAAIPVGNCIEVGTSGELRFYNFRSGASFWSATPYNYHEGAKKLTNPNAYGRYIGYDDVVANKCVSNKKAYFSVRCVKDK